MRKQTIKLLVVLLAATMIVLTGCRAPEIEGTVLNIKQQKYDQALISAEKAVELYPENAEAWFYYGFLQSEHNQDYAKMNSAFEKVLSLNPAQAVNMDGRKVAAEDAIKQMRTNTFAQSYNKAVRDRNKAVAEADPMAKKELYESIKSNLMIASQVSPKRSEPYPLLVEAHLELGDTSGAVAALESATGMAGDDEEILLTAGAAYKRIGDKDRAMEMFERAATVNPQNSAVFQMLGVMESERENWPKANEYYQKAISMDSTNADLAFNIGVGYYNQKQYKDAIPFFEKSIDLDPDNVATSKVLAQAYVGSEDFDGAVNFLKGAVENFPEEARLHELLGIAYGRKGMAKEASAAIKKAEELQAMDN